MLLQLKDLVGRFWLEDLVGRFGWEVWLGGFVTGLEGLVELLFVLWVVAFSW